MCMKHHIAWTDPPHLSYTLNVFHILEDKFSHFPELCVLYCLGCEMPSRHPHSSFCLESSSLHFFHFCFSKPDLGFKELSTWNLDVLTPQLAPAAISLALGSGPLLRHLSVAQQACALCHFILPAPPSLACLRGETSNSATSQPWHL